MTKYYQQGDVVMIKIERVPNEAKPLTSGTAPVVVQEGEHTGHAHRFLSHNGNVQTFGNGDTKFLRVLENSTITHEEHLPITIEQGDYEVRIVRQKDPFSKVVSRVID